VGKAWSRFRPSSRTARILLAALFAFPIFSSLILPVFPDSAGFPHGFPHDFWPSFFLIPAATTLVEFPIAGLLASLIIFGPIFLWERHRKSLSIAWLACWVWFCFTNLVAQYSAPLWYHPRDEWGYTFAFEESIPVAGVSAALFFIIGFSLGRIALEHQDGRSTEPSGANGLERKNEL
jgi:hypothetical protein